MLKKSTILRGVALLALLAAIALSLSLGQSLDVASIQKSVNELGALAWLAFIALYAIATVLFFPGSVLTLAGGSLFGPVLGTFVNLTGATLGATLAFLLSRYLASAWVEEKIGGRLQQLKHGVESEGWRFVAFVRLVPLFPFNLLNYALGLTRIRLLDYIVASYLCMLPGAIAYTYLGYAGREALAGSEDLLQKGLIAIALLASVAFLPRLIRRFKQTPRLNLDELTQRLNNNEALLLLDVRTAKDYHGELGHLPTSHNIPLEEFAAHLPELNAYRDHSIALICTTDRRSQKAAHLLLKQGFTDVLVVSGGMQQWQQQQAQRRNQP